MRCKDKILWVCLLVAVVSACRSKKPVISTGHEEITGSSCYSMESITARCKWNITDGNKSYQVSGRIYILPDSVCYFRGEKLVEIFRGVVYKDSFAVISILERTCYKGSNQYLSRMAGYPVTPEIIYMLFTGDRCEKMYENIGFKVTAGTNHKIVLRGQHNNHLEIKLNEDNHVVEQITTRNRSASSSGFTAKYSEYRTYDSFFLPSVLEISAPETQKPFKISSTFQSVLFDQPQLINFRIPNSYKVVLLR
ncbi:MAG: DUF4292 domain-containing protein [Bacteroidales bacterium]|jgi:hypothetical protein|nr:DUF4292 domain-containing protein [Bacteroidales bacterium]